MKGWDPCQSCIRGGTIEEFVGCPDVRFIGGFEPFYPVVLASFVHCSAVVHCCCFSVQVGVMIREVSHAVCTSVESSHGST